MIKKINISKQNYPLIIFTIAAIIIASVVIKFATSRYTLSRCQRKISNIVSSSTLNQKQIDKIFEKSTADMDKLKQQNPFKPDAPKPQPPAAVEGILGNKALIGGQWYKVGDSVSGAKILEIDATLVKIEWQGQPKDIFVIVGPPSDSNNRNGNNSPGNSSKNSSGDTDADLEARAREKFMSLPPEQQQALQQKIATMTPDQRKEFMRKFVK